MSSSLSPDDLNKIFSAVFSGVSESDILILNRNTSEVWDSLKHIELITELEEFFEIIIDEEKVSKIYDFQSALQAITNDN
jgi:acyl carrier protein